MPGGHSGPNLKRLLVIDSTRRKRHIAILSEHSNSRSIDSCWLCCVRFKRGSALRAVSVRRTHLPNSSFKGDGVRVFLSGRDRPYRQDFHAPTKLLSETIRSPGRSGMPATWRIHFQCRHQPRHQCQRHPQMVPLYRDQPAAPSLPAFVPLKAAPKRPAEASVIIELPMADQLITVKWPNSDPEGCAQFIRAVAQRSASMQSG